MNMRKSLQDLLNDLKLSHEFKENIVHWETIEAKEAKMIDFPKSIHSSIKAALQRRGINALYTHQREAYESVMERKNIVAVTPTASGKTLCYNLPVLERSLKIRVQGLSIFFPQKHLHKIRKAK